MDRKEYYRLYRKLNSQKLSEYRKQYYQEHLDEEKERMKLYYQEHGNNNSKEYLQEYNKTQKGRAVYLINAYKKADKVKKRLSEETITNYVSSQWIIENVFNSKCHYCGETDWTKLGCDRIDNTKPHTIDNIVPCCRHCNCKKHTKSYEEFKQNKDYE